MFNHGQGRLEILKGFLTQSPPQILLMDLKEEYDRLFSDTGEERISLVESFYKPWTQDPHCSLPFAKEKGFLMGDSAIHLSTLFQHCGLEVEDPLKGCQTTSHRTGVFILSLSRGRG